MIRGTTPSIGVRIPVTLDNVDKLELVVKQDGKIIFDQIVTDFEQYGPAGDTVIFTLSQDTTLAMNALGNFEKARMQATVLYKDGTVDKTPLTLVPINDILKNEVME